MSKSVKGKSKAVTVLIQNEAKADEEFYSTQGFESRESDNEDPETKLWDVVDILDERNGFFLIKWAGVDEHGEPWKNSWVPRVDVTDDLVKEWRMKKATATKMKGLEKGKGKDTRRKSVGRPPKSQASSIASSSKTSIEKPESSNLGSAITKSRKSTRRASINDRTEIETRYEAASISNFRSPVKKRKRPISDGSSSDLIHEEATPRKVRKTQADSPEGKVSVTKSKVTSKVIDSEGESEVEAEETNQKRQKPGPYFPPGTRPKKKKKKPGPTTIKAGEDEDEDEAGVASRVPVPKGSHREEKPKENNSEEVPFPRASNIPTDLPTPPHRTLQKRRTKTPEESPSRTNTGRGRRDTSESPPRSSARIVAATEVMSPRRLLSGVKSRMKRKSGERVSTERNSDVVRDGRSQEKNNEDNTISSQRDQEDKEEVGDDSQIRKTNAKEIAEVEESQFFVPATQTQSQSETLPTLILQQHLQAQVDSRLPDVPNKSLTLDSSALVDPGSSPRLLDSDRFNDNDLTENAAANNDMAISQDLTSPESSSSADQNTHPKPKALGRIPIVSPSKFKPYLPRSVVQKPISAHIYSALHVKRQDATLSSSIEQESSQDKLRARSGSRNGEPHKKSPIDENIDEIEDISGDLNSKELHLNSYNNENNDIDNISPSQAENEELRAFEKMYIDFDGNAGGDPREISSYDVVASPTSVEHAGVSERRNGDVVDKKGVVDDSEEDADASLGLNPESGDSNPIDDPFVVDTVKDKAPTTPTTATSFQDEDPNITPPFRLLGSPTKLVKTPTQLLNESLGRITTLSNEINDLRSRLLENEEKRLNQDNVISELEAEVTVLKKTLEQEREDHQFSLLDSPSKSEDTSALVDDLKKERDTLTAEIALLKLKVVDAQKDGDMFRELYGKASSFVDELRKENKELEARATLAEGQVKKGLELIRSRNDTQLKKVSDERDVARSQLKILLTKDQRTNDEVRKRAAREGELKPVIEELNREIREVRGELSGMLRERGNLLVRNKEVEEEMGKVRKERDGAVEEVERMRVEIMRYAARERSVKKMLNPSALTEMEPREGEVVRGENEDGIGDDDGEENGAEGENENEDVYLCKWADNEGIECSGDFPTTQDHMFIAKDHL